MGIKHKNPDHFFACKRHSGNKKFYRETLRSETKLDFFDSGTIVYRTGGEELSIILKDVNQFRNAKPAIWFEVDGVYAEHKKLREKQLDSYLSLLESERVGPVSVKFLSAVAWDHRLSGTRTRKVNCID